MAYLGSWKIDDFLTFYVNTHTAATGAATDADAVPPYRIYEDETGAAIANANMAKLDDANTIGFYSERIQLLTATGFEKGKQYVIYIAATVATVVGTIHHTFQIEAEVDANTVSDGVDVTSISGDSNSANNLELDYDGTGYAKANSTIGIATAVTNQVTADITAISGDSGAADNAEAFFDGTGYAGTNNVIPTVTTVSNQVTADMTAISGDAAAANNAESFFDGTGYAGTNNVIPTVTTVTNRVTANTDQIEGGDATDAINAACDASLITYNLDHLLLTATVGADMTAEVADNTILSRVLANGNTSDFVPSTDGLQPIRDRGDAAWVTATTVTTVTGNVDGSVGSVTGNVGGDVQGNVDGSVASVTARVTANTDQIEGGDATDAINAACDASLITYNLDHLLLTATVAADMTAELADNTILSRIISNGDTSAFVPSTDGLQPIRDRGDAAWVTATTVTTVTGNVDGSVGSVTGTVGSVTGNVGGDVQGNVDGSVASVTNQVSADITAISGDATAANNAESFFDGTGYAGTNNVIPSVTTVTGNVDGSVASVTARVTANTDQIEGVDATNQIRDSVLDDATRFSGADIASILNDTGTSGVVVSTATQQAIADETLKRDVSNTEGAAGTHSLTTVVLGTTEIEVSGATLTIRKTDGTAFTTKTLTTDATADLITAIT